MYVTSPVISTFSFSKGKYFPKLEYLIKAPRIIQMQNRETKTTPIRFLPLIAFIIVAKISSVHSVISKSGVSVIPSKTPETTQVVNRRMGVFRSHHSKKSAIIVFDTVSPSKVKKNLLSRTEQYSIYFDICSLCSCKKSCRNVNL